ncbi:phosphocholine-specific phospholipase C [Amycolatopsis minnesotensis]|uniref:phospholipase C n=1 Tax=Amycolatopsis minnesotensis TaxID=337894 RepID=A0ABN2R7T8_9PSEU
MKRRDLLKGAAALSGVALLPVSVRDALALAMPEGGLDGIEHVVIFMQENRAFDHYFGTYRGTRGFSDPAAITLPGGEPVFRQPDGSSYVLPYRVDDQFMTGTPHDRETGHAAWHNGRYDDWVGQKSARTMTYLDRASLPFYHALADAFTLCDAYHCSELGPTNPNRFYLFSGMLGDEPLTGKRAVGNDSWQNPKHPGYSWTTYAERLEAAGKSWQVYQEWDNYGDNSLDYFTSIMAVGKKALAKTVDDAGKPYTKVEYFYYDVLAADADRRKTLLAQLDQGVRSLTGAERRIYDRALARVAPDQLAPSFRADVAAGRLPAVSWIVAPEKQCEHPQWGPNTGADLVKDILDALASDVSVWNKTLFLLTYDENDGFFDHVPPPVPPVTSDDGKSTVDVEVEMADGIPIGLGNRVPMIVVSPWSRGGKVCSQVFDHTSVLRLLETWTGVAEPNISPWRRAVCGDLTSAFDFGSTGTYPDLPDPVPTTGPDSTDPKPPSDQRMPVQEPGVRTARPLPYDLAVSARVTPEQLLLDFANQGSAGAHFYVYAKAFRSDGPWRYTVEQGKSLSDYWKVGDPDGAYDLNVLGPNGFVRRFSGNRITATTSGNANPEVTLTYTADTRTVSLAMRNDGDRVCTITVAAGNRADGPWRYELAPGKSTSDSFDVGGALDGWYDLTATADTADGFTRHFAGHGENGAENTTDPAIGSRDLSSTVARSATAAASPQEIRLDLGSVRTVTGVRYPSRQDGAGGGYELSFSTDGRTWPAPATGAFAGGTRAGMIPCAPTRARYVRLRALSVVDGGRPWATAAEVIPVGW